jgi:phosphoribosylformimino-5-aminoimidazole carboxamide ribotide isomerase
MRFRPCIDLRNGRVVQIVGGTLDDDQHGSTKVNFESELSSAEYADMYQKDQLSGGHVIALGPNNENAIKMALKAWPKGLQIGGGVNLENAEQWLNEGASHVIVTSYIFKDGKVHMDRLRELVGTIGREHLVLDLSCRKKGEDYFIVTDRWQTCTQTKICPDMLSELAEYCDEFLVHGADVEGLRGGMEESLIKTLGAHCPIPVTYAGGASSLHDLERVKELGQGRVDLTIGSALDIFGGSTKYRDVVQWQREQTSA